MNRELFANLPPDAGTDGGCMRCGAKPGQPCDAAAHDAHADSACGRPCRLGCPDFDRCDGDRRLGAPAPAPTMSVAKSLLAWRRHVARCMTCGAAGDDRQLCHAGAVLFAAIGNHVPDAVPVAYERPAMVALGNLRTMPTSNLLTMAAGLLETGALPCDLAVAQEMRVRARKLRDLAALNLREPAQQALVMIGEVQS